MLSEQELNDLCGDEELYIRMWRESLTIEQIESI